MAAVNGVIGIDLGLLELSVIVFSGHLYLLGTWAWYLPCLDKEPKFALGLRLQNGIHPLSASQKP